jgi:hypothetical protein
MITIQKVTCNVQSVSRQSSDIIDTPNCVLEDRVRYSTARIPNVLCDGHLQIINFWGLFEYTEFFIAPHHNTRLSCLTIWPKLTAWQPTDSAQGCTRLTLTPSIIPNSNYVIMVSDWKYFCVLFGDVIIRCTESFWSPCTYPTVKTEQCSETWRLNYRRSRITQKKAYDNV